MFKHEEYAWSPAEMLEITLHDPDSFLKIKETLTRIGVASKKEMVLYPSCHILQKRGRYFICHFKEMFAIEGKVANISMEDILRRNTIAKLLEQWGLCSVLKQELQQTSLANIKVVSFRDKKIWDIRPKFMMMGDRMRQHHDSAAQPKGEQLL